MRASPTDGSGSTSLLHRALPVLAILLGLSVSVGTDSLFPLVQGVQRSDDIVRRSRKYQEAVRANEALAGEVRFYATPEGARAALLKQGQLLPGQHMGRITEAPAPVPAPLGQSQQLQRWIAVNEERGAQALRDLGETLMCYAGWRPQEQPPDGGNSAPDRLSKPPKQPAKPPPKTP